MNESPERAKDAYPIPFLSPVPGSLTCDPLPGVPSLPSAARFTPGYASCAGFAAPLTEIANAISQMYKLQSALKARSRAVQGERAERSEPLEPWVEVAIDASPVRAGQIEHPGWKFKLTEGSFAGRMEFPSSNRNRLHPPALARNLLNSSGFVLIDSRFRPVYANPESIRILGYPNLGSGASMEAVDGVLAQKILSFLPRDMSFAENACALQFRSGRRLYRCRAFVVCNSWNGAESETRIALLLERGIPGRPLGIRQNRLFAGMYEDPFSFVSNPRFYHLSRAHQDVLNSMKTLVAERRGIGVLLGQSGIGKTALVHYLSESMRHEAQIAVFPGSFEDRSELVRSLMAILGIEGIQKNPDTNLEIFEQWLFSKNQEGRGVVLVCDDAQELDLRTMENLHLLSQMKAGRQRLLQIIMSGRHDVLAKLEDAAANGNDGGINICCRLLPFDEAEVSSYILHRLRIAGCDRQVFSMAALASIAVYSRGIPLYVTMLCRQCLSLAVSNNLRLIEENMVDDAAYDLVLRAQPADAVQQSSMRRRDRRGLRLVEKS